MFFLNTGTEGGKRLNPAEAIRKLKIKYQNAKILRPLRG
jgi:hypothetical protein